MHSPHLILLGGEHSLLEISLDRCKFKSFLRTYPSRGLRPVSSLICQSGFNPQGGILNKWPFMQPSVQGSSDQKAKLRFSYRTILMPPHYTSLVPLQYHKKQMLAKGNCGASFHSESLANLLRTRTFTSESVNLGHWDEERACQILRDKKSEGTNCKCLEVFVSMDIMFSEENNANQSSIFWLSINWHAKRNKIQSWNY